MVVVSFADVAAVLLQNPDFFEGVRAMLLDKDQSPQWADDGIESVSSDQVHDYFLALGVHPKDREGDLNLVPAEDRSF